MQHILLYVVKKGTILVESVLTILLFNIKVVYATFGLINGLFSPLKTHRLKQSNA